MKIVVLDGFAVNPGDLSWDFLQVFGDVEVYDNSSSQEVRPRLRDADVVLSNRAPIDRETIAAAPRLRLIQTLGTGFDMIDLAAAKEHGVQVCNVPGYAADAVAQHVFALLLALTSNVQAFDAQAHAGQWSGLGGFDYRAVPMTGLAGKTMGIVGFGAIGQKVAQIAQAFGMQVCVHTRSAVAQDGVKLVSFPELLACSDAVSLHCPLNAQTRGLMDANAFSAMKRTAYLINTARGALVDERALADALNRGEIAGAGLDVLCNEPPDPNGVLFHAKNCLITPHVAWASVDARRMLLSIVEENVRAFLAGTPIRTIE